MSFISASVTFYTFDINSRVEFVFYIEAGGGCRCGDQLDDGQAACQRPATPVLGDVAEKAVLDLVPFRPPRRVMANRQGQARFVGN